MSALGLCRVRGKRDSAVTVLGEEARPGAGGCSREPGGHRRGWRWGPALGAGCGWGGDGGAGQGGGLWAAWAVGPGMWDPVGTVGADNTGFSVGEAVAGACPRSCTTGSICWEKWVPSALGGHVCPRVPVCPSSVRKDSGHLYFPPGAGPLDHSRDFLVGYREPVPVHGVTTAPGPGGPAGGSRGWDVHGVKRAPREATRWGTPGLDQQGSTSQNSPSRRHGRGAEGGTSPA